MKKLLLALFICAFLSISLNSSAQDYLITFAGTGAANLVDSIEVENLSTGAATTLNGDDILHLTSVVGISQLENINSSGMRIYPNPMMDNSILALHAPEAGDAVITVYEITGKTIAKIQSYLENSRQEFRLSGLNNGMYLVNVTGNTFQYSGKILCSGQADGNPGIEKVSSTAESNIEKISKKEYSATQGTVVMHYTTGERLKFKAISGIYSTIKTDIPTQDKTLGFNFIPCTDGDNNNYPIVEIGTQIWMAENLKTTKFRDSTYLQLEQISELWTAAYLSSYCWYNNDSVAFNATYGPLYNWFPININKFCPKRWHVPSDAEWTALIGYLGGIAVAGGKLKESGFDHWKDPNINATNETGFSALPGGFREVYGKFSSNKYVGFWWSSTEKSYYESSAWCLGNEYTMLYGPSTFRKTIGFSVRCMKDE